MCGSDGCDGSAAVCGGDAATSRARAPVLVSAAPISSPSSTPAIPTLQMPRAPSISHATAPGLRDRVQPLQEMVDLLDPSVRLPGSSTYYEGSGLIAELHRLNARASTYGRVANDMLQAPRAIAGIVEVWEAALSATPTMGPDAHAPPRAPAAAPPTASTHEAAPSSPADQVRGFTALRRLSRELYAHVQTQAWMLEPLRTAFPQFVAARRRVADQILDVLHDEAFKRRFRDFVRSANPLNAQDVLIMRQVGEVLARAATEVRATERETRGADRLAEDLEDPESNFSILVETIRGVMPVLKAPTYVLNLLTIIEQRLLMRSLQTGARSAQQACTSHLNLFLGMSAHHAEELRHALHEGNRHEAREILGEFVVSAPLDVASGFLAVFEAIDAVSELAEHPDLRHELEVIATTAEAVHAVGEAAVSIARTWTRRRATLATLGRCLEATENGLNIGVATINIINGVAEFTEANRHGDTFAMSINGLEIASGWLAILALSGVPAIAAGVVALDLTIAALRWVRSGPPGSQAIREEIERQIERLKQASPWHPASRMDEVTHMNRLVHELEEQLEYVEWSIIDVRRQLHSPQITGDAIRAYRATLRGLGIPPASINAIVIDPNGLAG